MKMLGLFLVGSSVAKNVAERKQRTKEKIDPECKKKVACEKCPLRLACEAHKNAVTQSNLVAANLKSFSEKLNRAVSSRAGK